MGKFFEIYSKDHLENRLTDITSQCDIRSVTYWPPYVEIVLLDRGPVRFVRPAGDLREWERAFGEISRAVIHNYRQRQAQSGISRRAGANSWLMQVAYDLLLGALEEDQLEELQAWNQRHGRYQHRRLPTDYNPFQAGLMALFALEPKAITPQNRERIGKRLWHAARHFVPSPFLLGFIKQLESAGLEQRAFEGHIEQGFEDWVSSKLAGANDLMDRGLYPDAIKAAADHQRRRDFGLREPDRADDEAADDF